MSTYIRSIGKCYVNGIGFDLHVNPDGTANIRPVKLSRDLPPKLWKKFDNLEAAENFIDEIDNDDLTGAGLVDALKNGPFADALTRLKH